MLMLAIKLRTVANSSEELFDMVCTVMILKV